MGRAGGGIRSSLYDNVECLSDAFTYIREFQN